MVGGCSDSTTPRKKTKDIIIHVLNTVTSEWKKVSLIGRTQCYENIQVVKTSRHQLCICGSSGSITIIDSGLRKLRRQNRSLTHESVSFYYKNCKLSYSYLHRVVLKMRLHYH